MKWGSDGGWGEVKWNEEVMGRWGEVRWGEFEMDGWGDVSWGEVEIDGWGEGTWGEIGLAEVRWVGHTDLSLRFNRMCSNWKGTRYGLGRPGQDTSSPPPTSNYVSERNIPLITYQWRIIPFRRLLYWVSLTFHGEHWELVKGSL